MMVLDGQQYLQNLFLL